MENSINHFGPTRTISIPWWLSTFPFHMIHLVAFVNGNMFQKSVFIIDINKSVIFWPNIGSSHVNYADRKWNLAKQEVTSQCTLEHSEDTDLLLEHPPNSDLSVSFLSVYMLCYIVITAIYWYTPLVSNTTTTPTRREPICMQVPCNKTYMKLNMLQMSTKQTAQKYNSNKYDPRNLTHLGTIFQDV